jgi:thiol:disulfide interchange protein DsbC
MTMKVMPMIMGGVALLAAGGLAGTLVSGIAAEARPSSLDSTAVAASLAQRLPKTKISHVDCKKLSGICEITAGANLFYTDAQARYLVIGRVYDMATRQDLTAARLLALNPDLLTAGAARREAGEDERPQQRASVPTRVSLAGLPANGAITWGPADGPKVVVFSDFNCSYCKKLEGELKAIGARVEERPISIFGAESRQVAEQVLCSPRPEMSLRMAYSGLALANPKPCDTSGLDANEAFARAHGFGGTPVIVRPSDGAVLEGYRPAAALREFLRAAPRQTSKG